MTAGNVERQTAYGVFKPVGHVLVALHPGSDLSAAVSAWVEAGFDGARIATYTPAQMKIQADADIAQAGWLANVGQELNLVKAQRELAEQGCSFVLVPAADDEAAQRVAAVAGSVGALRAQRYGHLVIEELLPVGETDQQDFASPERGLDAQTLSGRESADVDPAAPRRR